MTLVAEKKQTQTSRPPRKVPKEFIHEMMDGKPLYRKGYKEVLSGKKTFEEIVGSSSLQAFLVEYILRILIRTLDEKKYRVFSNEVGLHLAHKENLSNDIAVYEKSVLTPDKISTKYADVPAKLVVEVDIDVDLSDRRSLDYIAHKTQKLLQFGTQKVVWILTDSQMVLVALPGRDWIMTHWANEVELLDGQTFNIASYLKEEGIQLEGRAD